MEIKEINIDGTPVKGKELSAVYAFEEFGTTYAPLTEEEQNLLAILKKRDDFHKGGFKLVSYQGHVFPVYVNEYEGEEIVPVENVIKDGVIDRFNFSLTTRGFIPKKDFLAVKPPVKKDTDAPTL